MMILVILPYVDLSAAYTNGYRPVVDAMQNFRYITHLKATNIMC